MSDELKEHNILKLILIVRFACSTLYVGHPINQVNKRNAGLLSHHFVRERQRDSCRLWASAVGMDDQLSIGCSDWLPAAFCQWRYYFGYVMNGVEFAPLVENIDNVKAGWIPHYC
jgi:hypothetical protein